MIIATKKQKTHMKLLQILLISILAIGFTSCKKEGSTTTSSKSQQTSSQEKREIVYKTERYADKKIDPQIKAEIKAMNDKVMKACISDNPSLLYKLFLPELLKDSGDEIGELVRNIHHLLKSENYEVLEEFYIPNPPELMEGLASETSVSNEFDVFYISSANETYISLLIPEKEYDEFLMMTVYSKEDGEWKLNNFQFGAYSIQGKKAFDLYQESKEFFNKDYLVDASNSMLLCSRIWQPANRFFKYKTQEEIVAFSNRLSEQVNKSLKFPMTIEEIPSKPKVFNIMPFPIEDGFFPMVDYVTTFEIEDSINIGKENEDLHKIMGKIFPGIDQDRDRLLYTIYNKLPNKQEDYASVGMMRSIP